MNAGNVEAAEATQGRLRRGRQTRRAITLVGACGVMAAAVGGSLAATSGGKGAVPAFLAQKLARAHSGDWITNGGSLSNDRYSTLGQIDTGNVAQLKGIWHVRLKSGTIAREVSPASGWKPESTVSESASRNLL